MKFQLIIDKNYNYIFQYTHRPVLYRESFDGNLQTLCDIWCHDLSQFIVLKQTPQNIQCVY